MKKRSEARRITLKFPAVCKACQTQLPVGSSVTWYPGGTVYGTSCHKSPFPPRKPKASVPQPKATPSPTGTTAIEQLLALSQANNSPKAHTQFVKNLQKLAEKIK